MPCHTKGQQPRTNANPAGHLFEVLRVQDPMHIPLPDALQRQRGNQRGADTAPILRRQDLNGVLLLGVRLLRPVEDLAQGLGAAGLEVRVLVEDGAVGADVARREALLLADGGYAARRQARRAGPDQLGRAPDQLELRQVGADVQLRLE